MSVFSNVASGIALPVWHCPFQTCGVDGKTMPCRATAVASCKELQQRSTYEKELWAHVSMRHGFVLRSIAKKWSLIEVSMKEAEVLLTLYNSALAEKERSSVPILGHSTDRRTIEHVGQVFKNDNVHVLMCFMCACKEIAHAGFNKSGEGVEKGNICYRRDKKKPSFKSSKEMGMKRQNKLGRIICPPSETGTPLEKRSLLTPAWMKTLSNGFDGFGGVEV